MRLRYNIDMRRVLIFLLFISLAAGVAASSHTVNAAQVLGFKAGEIMDDVVMTNSKSMTVPQIQNFLNSKVPACDTWGTQPSEFGGGTRAEWAASRGISTPFICLRNYTEGGKSGAQIIYDVAQKYTINPQSLIVLLQKEQGLVTDTWPLPIQYRSATGYGCPDTAPCDSQYYGLINQLDWSAKMFRSIIDQNPNWYSPYFVGNNPRVYWNPDTERCGSAPLNIVNWTTAGLYSYTPYRPNQAALDAGYGLGDSCSAYGNRNFYSYFKDWFGSTQGSPFFAINGRIYIDGAENRYYYVPSPDILSTYGVGSTFNSIREVDSSYIQGKTNAGNLPRMARFEGLEIYAVDESKLHHVMTAEDYESYGYTFGQEALLPSYLAQKYTESTDMSTILKQHNRPETYFVSEGKKQHIGNSKAYTTLGSPVYNTLPTVTLSSGFVNSITNGTPILANGSIVKAIDTDEHYIFSGGSLRSVDTPIATDWGLPVDYTAHSSLVNLLPKSNAVGRLVKSSSDKYYILDNTRKLLVEQASLANMGMGTEDFTLAGDDILNRFTEKPMTSLVQQYGTNEVYAIQNGQLYHIYGSADLTSLGYSWSQLIRLKPGSVQLFTNSGKKLFHPGRLVRVANTPEVYLIDGAFSRRHIPSEDTMIQYGFSFNNVQVVKSSDLNGYTVSTPLNKLIKDMSDKYWLVDSGKRWGLADESIVNAYLLVTAEATPLNDSILSYVPSQGELTYLVRARDRLEVYKIENGNKRWIKSEQAFISNGFSWSQVKVMSQSFVNSLQNGTDIQ